MKDQNVLDSMLNNEELNDPTSKILESFYYEETILSKLVFSNVEIIILSLESDDFLSDLSINRIIELSHTINRFIKTIYMKEWLMLKKLETILDYDIKQNHCMAKEDRSTIENKLFMNDDYTNSIMKLEHVLSELMSSIEIFLKEENRNNTQKNLSTLKDQLDIGLSQLKQLQALILRKRKLFNNFIIKNSNVVSTPFANDQDNLGYQQLDKFKQFLKMRLMRLPLKKEIRNMGIYYLQNQDSNLPKIFAKETSPIKPWLNENLF